MKNRKYGHTRNLTHDELAHGVASLKYVKTAFLFGSRASGQTHPQSDYDLAFEMEELPEESWGMQAKAWMDVCDVLRVKEYDVDVVDLATADPYLKRAIAQNHILLKGDENDVSRLLG
jgi:predicted nucleotidyltransferase